MKFNKISRGNRLPGNYGQNKEKCWLKAENWPNYGSKVEQNVPKPLRNEENDERKAKEDITTFPKVTCMHLEEKEVELIEEICQTS